MNENKIENNDEKLLDNELKNIDKKYFRCFSLPKAVYFIILTEFCERFTYYGMRTILILYLTQHLLLREDKAVSIYHFFVSLCYFTTIIGSFIADNYLGKFKTLVIIGTVYIMGSITMSLTAIPTRNISGAIIGLLLIALGTGGVKACVGPFGGDQIPAKKKVILDSYFSTFYLAINIGALLSTFITPVLRAEVACNGKEDCYPLAFGVPAILMTISLAFFLLGRSYYIEVPVNNNIYLKACRCIMVSIKNWFQETTKDRNKQLLDYASKEYDEGFIRDLRIIYHIIILFLPLTIYWALFEQMGSRWTLQAAQMDGEVFRNIIILPDQMFIFNVLLIVIFIVIFDNCIYPILYKFNPTVRPLKRMTFGIIFTSLAFLTAFILQKRMEDLQPAEINNFNSRVILVNSHSCNASVSFIDGSTINANSFQTSLLYHDLISGQQQIILNLLKCDSQQIPNSIQTTVTFHPGQINFLIIENYPNNNITIRVYNDSQSSNIKGYPLIRLLVTSVPSDQYQFQLKYSTSNLKERKFSVDGKKMPYISNWEKLSRPGRYIWSVRTLFVNNSKSSPSWTRVLSSKKGIPKSFPIKIFSSEVSLFYMTFSNNLQAFIVIPLRIHSGSQISILWQLPQYLLMALGEVLINIPGLTFSYDQAPLGMKSLVNGLWYFYGGLGNAVVIIVANIHFFEKQSYEYLIFALVCCLCSIVFAILAYLYKIAPTDDYISID